MILVVHIHGPAPELGEYETAALAIFAEYGDVLHRLRVEWGEIHVLRVESEARLEDYRADERVAALSYRRERVVTRTEVFQGEEM